MSDRPPTLREIAAKLGTSAATVSMALRNQHGISSETARRVQAVAREMGWQPNPLISAYQSQVRSRKPSGYRATIAWLEGLPGALAGGLAPLRLRMREAATLHAAQSGFKIEEIALEDLLADKTEKSAALFRRIMESRGIHGFIIPVGRNVHQAAHDWSPFAVAVIGRIQRLIDESPVPLITPVRQHSVATDSFHAARTAWQHLRNLGCRRVGLAISRYHHAASDYLYEAALTAQQTHLAASEQVPMLCFAHSDLEVPDGFAAWLKKHKPDGLLCEHSKTVDWLRALGYRVPDDIAVAHLNLGPDEPGWSGINGFLEGQAVAAVDLIVGQLIRNERTAPAIPKQVLIQGTWVAGTTTPAPARA